jgi:MinD-like ATPase involved in chromosome partitioning or flagellar assembly
VQSKNFYGYQPAAGTRQVATISNLAVSLAQTGKKILLIDADSDAKAAQIFKEDHKG